MACYTFSCFSIFTKEYVEDEKRVLIMQNIVMFLMHFLAYMVMYLKMNEPKLMFFYAAQVVYFLAVILLYSLIYPTVSKLIVNNMCMLISIGLIMITRLNYGSAVKQFIFAVLGSVFGLVVPVIIRKMKSLIDWTYIYAGVGLGALTLVAVFAATSGGAKLGFEIAGIGIQPSEFVKILFVFFVASSLKKSTEFKNVVVTTALAAAHVLILVLSTDLGAALIMFVVYLVMLYVATQQPLYAVAGVGAGSFAAVIGYKLFAHIKVRVAAWKDPFATYSDRLSGGAVTVRYRNRKLVWNGTLPGKSGSDPGSGNRFYLFGDRRGTGSDICTLSDPCLCELLCDVFEYCNGDTEPLL